MTNTQIKPVTKYEVNGKLFDTEEAAQQHINELEIQRFIEECSEVYDDRIYVNDLAYYLIEHKERLIHLLSFIK